jgi:excinuclease ABC subunit C
METYNDKRSERMRQLHTEAMELPERPGVYIMRDASDKVIYVGKSRNLRNRVSQYFGNNEKNLKTHRMASSVKRFEIIHCDTEMEALTLENTLIKQHSPRYNIKLKDAKSYPFLKITADKYPKLVMTRKRSDDGAKYFGPYSGTQTVFAVISLMNKTFGLYSCNRKFPADIGKSRPCINYQI